MVDSPVPPQHLDYAPALLAESLTVGEQSAHRCREVREPGSQLSTSCPGTPLRQLVDVGITLCKCHF